MRVAFIAWRDLANPQWGGSEVFVDRLATGLQERGWDVSLLCGGPVEARSYRVVANGGTFSQYLTAPFRFRRKIGKVDLVVDVSNGIPFFTPLWHRGPSLCFVHHIHGRQWFQAFPRPIAAIGAAVESRVFPRVYRRHHVVSVSESSVADLVELGIDPSHTSLLHNGVDVVPGVADASDNQRASEPLFVLISRLVPHKGVDRILDAWRTVEREIGGRLVIVGDGPEQAKLEALAGPGVEFVGRIGEDDKKALLQSAWLLVHGAHHEGWGIVILEAAAEATPTLAFDVVGVRDAVVDGVTGVLADDVSSLAATWVALARDPNRRSVLGAAAHERAMTFSWDRTIEEFMKLAETMVAGA